MRLSTPILYISIPAITLLSACSTVPSAKSLTNGIDSEKIAAQKTTMRASNDPICTTFYENVIEAANKSAKNKRTNAQLASTGVSIGSVLAGIGPIGSIAAQSAARQLIGRSVSDVSSTSFDPENKFDRAIIESAKEVQCPVKIKAPATTTTTP